MPGNIFDQFEEEVNQLCQLTSARVTRNRLPQILRMDQEPSTRQNLPENPSNSASTSQQSPMSQQQPPEIIVNGSPGHEYANTQPCYVSLPRINISVPAQETDLSGSADDQDPSQSYPSNSTSLAEVAATRNPAPQQVIHATSLPVQSDQGCSQNEPEYPASDSVAQMVKHMSDMLCTMFSRYEQLQRQTLSVSSTTGNLSKPMRRSIPKFSGRSDSSVEEWISIFSILTEDYSEKDTKISFAESLTDYAKKWYIRNYENFRHDSSKEWLRMLKAAFYRTKDERLDALWRIQWKENDSPRQFIRFLEDEAASLGDVIGIATLLKITKNALRTHPEYPRFVDKFPNSMSHILNMLLLYAPKEGEVKDPCPVLHAEDAEENLLLQQQGSAQFQSKINKLKRYNVNAQSGQESRDQNPGHQNLSGSGPPFFSGECRYCKIYGHKIRDCPIRPPQVPRFNTQQQQFYEPTPPNFWAQRVPYEQPQMQPQYPTPYFLPPRQNLQFPPRQQYPVQGYRGRNPNYYTGFHTFPPVYPNFPTPVAPNPYGGSLPFYPAVSHTCPTSQSTLSSPPENPGPSHISPSFPAQENSNGLN